VDSTLPRAFTTLAYRTRARFALPRATYIVVRGFGAPVRIRLDFSVVVPFVTVCVYVPTARHAAATLPYYHAHASPHGSTP